MAVLYVHGTDLLPATVAAYADLYCKTRAEVERQRNIELRFVATLVDEAEYVRLEAIALGYARDDEGEGEGEATRVVVPADDDDVDAITESVGG